MTDNSKIKLLISFATYPRKNDDTYRLFERTFKTLIDNQNLSNVDLKFIVVGDDYTNINELKPIFNNYNYKDGQDYQFYNINVNDALRNVKGLPFEVKWKQAVQRSKIFILEKVISIYTDYDYILMSADDEIYINKKIETSIEYIQKYNEPDFVFNFGLSYNGIILPDKKYAGTGYPLPSQCISSGCIYKLKNKQFINTIIRFRKYRWSILSNIIKDNLSIEKYINEQKNNTFMVRKNPLYTINPEDNEIYEYMKPFFMKKIFTSLLIPKLLIHHETQYTLQKYID